VQDIALDGRTLLFTLALSLAAGVLFGVLPALHVARGDLHDTLKASGGRGVAGGQGRARSTLVVAQVALSLVLLVGAGLMLKSFQRLAHVNPGFDAEHVLTAKLSLPRTKYDSAYKQVAFFQQVLERVAAVPGVRAAGAINWLPLSGLRSATDFTIDERPAPAQGQAPDADVRSVDASYFRAMGIPLLKGESFTGRETAGAPKTVVISEALAQKYFPGENPVGKRISMEWDDTLHAQIVGVVGDVKHLGLDSIAPATIYWAMPQFPSNFMTLVVRTTDDPQRVAGAVRREVWSLDPDQPLADVKTMDDYLGQSVARRRFDAVLLGAFATLALTLAAIGLYGVVAYSVEQHTREFGIRMALGASAVSVLRRVLGQSLALTLVGVGAGLVGALLLTRLLASLLFEVSATDPAVFAGIALLLCATAVLASYLPAKRATRVDPMEALRYE
jgi:putative ABC transport system permease protein